MDQETNDRMMELGQTVQRLDGQLRKQAGKILALTAAIGAIVSADPEKIARMIERMQAAAPAPGSGPKELAEGYDEVMQALRPAAG